MLELIYQKDYFPELSYIFKHALAHDVAYSTLLLTRRKTLHRLVGTAIKELYAERLPEQYEMLAYHYYEGEDWGKALDYLMKAGDKATAAYANQDALDYYARALEVCGKLGDTALATAVDVVRRCGLVNITIDDLPGAIDDFNRMLTLASRLGDRRLEGMALAYRGSAERYNHEFETAEDTLRAALRVADEGFEDVRFFATNVLASLIDIFRGLTESKPLRQQLDELAPRFADSFALDHWLINRPFIPLFEARFDAVLEHLKQWHHAAEKSGDAFVRLINRWTESMAWCGKGEYEKALALLEDLLASCKRIGDIWLRIRLLNTTGWVYGELQDHQRAIEWNTEGVKAAQEANFPDPECENNARLNLGDNLLALGHLDEAEAQFQKVEQVVRNPQPKERFLIWLYAQRLFHSYGELWLIRGRHDKALAYADECLTLAEENNRRKNIVKGRRLRGQAFLAQSKLKEAEEELTTALCLAKEIGNPPQLWQTYVATGDLRQAQDRPNEAHRAYRDALSIIEDVAAGLNDESLKDTFLNSSHVQAIRRKANDASE